jgi:transmembrane sensor
MSTDEEKVREIIASQAGEWVAAHKAGPLEAADRRAFFAWLTSSPLHVEEYLGVALLSRRLPIAADDPDMPLEAILERVRDKADNVATIGSTRRSLWAVPRVFPRRWLWAAVPATAVAIGMALYWWGADHVTAERYATRHGEIRSWRLRDNSTLRLNTDTSVTARYSRFERLIEINRGEALFEVAHETDRPFRVVAGTASAVAVGTIFSVYREARSVLVTVVQGRVAVSAAAARGGPVSAAAGEQVRVKDGEPPDPATSADIQRSTAWLHREIVFEREPLALVAAEFNRYSALPIDIETPALGTLPITGIFSVDDTETFLDFLRSFHGVSIQATLTRIRVFQAPPPTPASPPGDRSNL